MKLPPATALTDIEWIPANRQAPLARLGLRTLEDLLRHYPRRHEDRRRFDRFPDGASPVPVCVCGTVISTRNAFYGRRRRGFEAVIESGDGALSQRLTCRWFNAWYVGKMLVTGRRIVVFGKTRTRGKKGGQILMDHPEFEMLEDDDEHSIHFNRITPVHPAADGITPRVLRSLVHRALDVTDLDAMPSLLPEDAESLTYSEALRAVHFPSDQRELEAVRPRLVLEEFFAIQAVLGSRRQAVLETKGFPKRGAGRLLGRFLESLPFEPTGSQLQVIEEIRADLAASRPMQRLLQGDVGSGKTLVALAAALLAVEAGYQVAFMAPTQILAAQHHLNASPLLPPLGLRLALRTGARKNGGDLPLFEGDGPPHIIFGTHALLYEGVEFEKLGLVIVDEQHKFGVMQRAGLVARGDHPDVLVMTATPIPRTLTQTLYGEMDVSLLKEKPARRGRILTAVRPEARLPAITAFLKEQLAAGRQVYVVYPLIEESEKLEAKAAAEEYTKWSELLAPHACGLLHGRLEARAKEEVMDAFRGGTLQVLVCTTVVEVGVDVPNATVMLIENAERFGLAQLHQLRGRVGRGEHVSYCILVHGRGGEEAGERLDVLAATEDGFEIAEADLRLRGPGDLLGTAQTGLPPVRIGDLLRDAEIMTRARQLADRVFQADPGLSAPQHATLKCFLQNRPISQDAVPG